MSVFKFSMLPPDKDVRKRLNSPFTHSILVATDRRNSGIDPPIVDSFPNNAQDSRRIGLPSKNIISS